MDGHKNRIHLFHSVVCNKSQMAGHRALMYCFTVGAAFIKSFKILDGSCQKMGRLCVEIRRSKSVGRGGPGTGGDGWPQGTGEKDVLV